MLSIGFSLLLLTLMMAIWRNFYLNHSDPDNKSVYFHAKYVEEAVAWFKGQAGTFSILAASPGDVSRVASTVDDMFRNSPQPTKAESEKAFGLEFVAMMGNVR